MLCNFPLFLPLPPTLGIPFPTLCMPPSPFSPSSRPQFPSTWKDSLMQSPLLTVCNDNCMLATFLSNLFCSFFDSWFIKVYRWKLKVVTGLKVYWIFFPLVCTLHKYNNQLDEYWCLTRATSGIFMFLHQNCAEIKTKKCTLLKKKIMLLKHEEEAIKLFFQRANFVWHNVKVWTHDWTLHVLGCPKRFKVKASVNLHNFLDFNQSNPSKFAMISSDHFDRNLFLSTDR